MRISLSGILSVICGCCVHRDKYRVVVIVAVVVVFIIASINERGKGGGVQERDQYQNIGGAPSYFNYDYGVELLLRTARKGGVRGRWEKLRAMAGRASYRTSTLRALVFDFRSVVTDHLTEDRRTPSTSRTNPAPTYEVVYSPFIN